MPAASGHPASTRGSGGPLENGHSNPALYGPVQHLGGARRALLGPGLKRDSNTGHLGGIKHGKETMKGQRHFPSLGWSQPAPGLARRPETRKVRDARRTGCSPKRRTRTAPNPCLRGLPRHDLYSAAARMRSGPQSQKIILTSQQATWCRRGPWR